MTTVRQKKIFLVTLISFLGIDAVVLIYKTFFNSSSFALNFELGLMIAAITLSTFWVWAFPHWIGLYFFVIGGFSNFLVIVINGGMPVHQTVSEFAVSNSEIHKYINDNTLLPFLADIFKFTIGNGDYYYFYSIGDVLLVVGLLLIVLQIIIYIFTKFTKKYQASKKKDIVFSESQ